MAGPGSFKKGKGGGGGGLVVKFCQILFLSLLIYAWGVDGGSRRRKHVDYKKSSCRPVKFKKITCRMSLKPKKGCVALSILGVYTPMHV